MRASSNTDTADTIKLTKNRFLTDRYQYKPAASEIAGTYSDGANDLVREIGRRFIEVS